MGEVPGDTMTASSPRYSRRLSDKILFAFHFACDQRDFEVAAQLLQVLEAVIAAPRLVRASGAGRRDQDALVAAHERLWQLRHPDPEEAG